MTTAGTWASIILLSMTPNLILGPSAAVFVGMEAKIPLSFLLPVVALASFTEGLIVAWLAGKSTQLGFIHRWIERMRSPKNQALAQRWGIWGGLTIGNALVGQEPILVALRWLGIELRQLWLPLALSNATFAWLYAKAVQFGLASLS